MKLKEYYHQKFRSDLVLLFRGFEPQEHSIILAAGHIWTHGCSELAQVPAERRPQFLACLYFTILVDQAMHTHFYFESRRFEELTRYPKFRVGLGHPAHLNPILVFEIPIERQLVSADAVQEIIPEMMDLFVFETVSFFRDHMPEINAQDFFHRLLADPDVNGGRQWAFAVVVDGKPAMKPASLHQLLTVELSEAIASVKFDSRCPTKS